MKVFITAKLFAIFLLWTAFTSTMASCARCSDDNVNHWRFTEGPDPEEPNLDAGQDVDADPGDGSFQEPVDECPWTDSETCALIDRLCAGDSQRGAYDEQCGCSCVDHGCEPQDAVGAGDCSEILGYAFNGWTCTLITGCECLGADCDGIYPLWTQCIWAHHDCADVVCDLMHSAQGTGDCDAILGYRYAGLESGCEPLHGCDCEGWLCSFLYDSEEQCRASHRTCETNAYWGCPPWRAAPEGTCERFLGYTFDGERCEPLTGCACVGDDCSFVDTDLEVCEKRTRDCTGHCGDPTRTSIDSHYERIAPKSCPDRSAYTVIDGRPQCVDPVTCEEIQ